jgi:hypothetical protein
VLFALAAFAGCGARTELPSPGACVALDDEVEAVAADLDMHLLLDSSGSMEDLTPSGATKWSAVVGALQAFFDAPEAAGLGVGLSCFPVVDLDVPEECNGNAAACGVPGACLNLGLCIDSGTACDVAIGCTDAAFPDEVCTPIGVCELAPDVLCATSLGIECAPGEGACLELGLCENRSSCELDVYQRPLIPVETLPAVGGALLAVMNARTPEGGTTTLPALQGVHEQAADGRTERPARRQVVVLATDGLPTSCDPTLDSGDDELAIRNLAQVAEDAAADGTRTFVVGVFTAEEAEDAQENLDAIARAGGTERAFLVGAEGALSDDFARALEEARISATSCEYALPAQAANVDLDLVSFTLRGDAGDRALELLPSASACTDGQAGAYVLDDVDAPRLVLCPSICATALEDGMPPIGVRGGCATVADP